MIEVPPRVLDFWEAFDSVEPVGEQWLQSASICYHLARVVSAQAASSGAEIDPETVEKYMPSRYLAPKTRKRKHSKGIGPNAMRAKLESKIGNG